MRALTVAVFLFVASLAGSVWYIAYTAHQDRMFMNETDRGIRGAQLQIQAAQVKCIGS